MGGSSRKGRVGQAQYWTFFGLYVLAVIGLVAFAFYSFVNSELSTGVTAILPIAPLGIYFRVIEMRRCRDIGWPAFLPWLLLVIPLGLAFTIRLGGAGGLGTGLGTVIAALTLPLLIALVDFAFAIAIGCIATKNPGEDYAKIFGGEPQSDGPRTEHDRFDEAIARALEARRAPEPLPAAPEPGPIPAELHARTVAGFGRKMV